MKPPEVNENDFKQMKNWNIHKNSNVEKFQIQNKTNSNLNMSR